ncbi:ankyrin repeat-containing domain protein [Dichotomopilus funicola]|uniref:Ankyrin repeat-containing domain protein n=1 Tax=Dichotomopilus funicola TaxID=1934379 RepID=A0AAN6V573_9PEZI|nr:ankyrin repeat-containing domain protein [Dichotomopilus funicola]
MAELGTIVGVISLGIQVSEGLIKYYTSYKDRESETAHTVKRLSHLLGILEILRKNLDEREFDPDDDADKKLLGVMQRSISDCEDLIHELQEENAKFATSAREPGSNRVTSAVRATGRRLAYPFRQSTLQKLDEDIDEISASLTLALQVLQQQDLGSVQDDIRDTKALLELVRAGQISAELQTWLAAPDASINYNDACKKKHPGTGLWFIRSGAFTTWLRTANSFLWLNGFAGCGKSVLSSTIIQHTMRHRRSNPAVGIAFFYFTFNDDAKQDTSAMLRGLIAQLASQVGARGGNDQQTQDGTLSRLHQSYRGSRPTDHALLDSLHQLVQEFEDVYIVVDALDESPRHKHREEVLEALGEMRKWPGPELHLLVTSRDEQDIREGLGFLMGLDVGAATDERIVSLKNESIDGDIASFVSGHLKDNRRLRKWDKYRDEIEQALTKGAKGVFRWVECQFAALEACPGSKTRLDALLNSLPRNLDKTYERMLANIEEESAEEAKRILTLLCTAKRPLAVEELIDGIAVELGDNPRFNEDSRLMGEDDIRHICPGFIEVDANVDDNSGSEATVRIAHYSVQEYLESTRILASGSSMARYAVQREQANTEVAAICLAYLRNRELCDACLRQNLSAWKFARMYPLANYAATNWPEHYREGHGDDGGLHELALGLFHDDQLSLVSWANIFKWGGYKRDGLGDRILSPLYLAARLGLDQIVSVLAAELKSSSSSCPSRPLRNAFEQALIAAATHGHASTVHALIDHGADVDFQGFEGTALHLASRHGHLAATQALLDRGADIEAQDYRGKTALYDSAAWGKEEIVQFLLDRGAQHTPLGAYDTPLECAASSGRDKIVAMLLDHGADPNKGRYRIPLEAAREHVKVVQILLDRGADATRDGPVPPLHAALEAGTADVVALLLDHGANIKRVGGMPAALQRAITNNNQPVVEILLDRGAEVNVPGPTYTPAEAAMSRQSDGILKLLLDRGADPNAGVVTTPLEQAAANGDIDSVRVLLEHETNKADPNLGKQETPLEAAAVKRAAGIVTLLLEHGADPNLGLLRTPLEAFLDEGIEPRSVLQLLVDHGADIHRGKAEPPVDIARRKGFSLEKMEELKVEIRIKEGKGDGEEEEDEGIAFGDMKPSVMPWEITKRVLGFRSKDVGPLGDD